MTGILLSIGIFLVDLRTPVGVPTWLLYLIPLLFARSDSYQHAPLILAGTCTALIYIAFIFSPSDSTGSSTLIHRTVVIIGIWITAVLMDRPRKESSEED